MRQIAHLALLIAAVIGVTFCGAAPSCAAGNVSSSSNRAAAQQSPAAVARTSDRDTDPAIADYVLGSGDNLRIIVFGEDSLTGQFTVAGNGRLSFPLIGDVQAAGKTVQQLRDEITSALSDGYIKDPKVSAEVMTFRPYYVLGEVEKPGQYPYVSGITVMNAVATAGGFTYRANSHVVFIKKPNETVEHKVPLNDALELAPGDTLRVGERYF